MIPTDDDHIKDSIRTHTKGDRIVIDVEVISWPHRHLFSAAAEIVARYC